MYTSTIFLEFEDANLLTVGETVTLMDWGNVLVTAVERIAGCVSNLPCFVVDEGFYCVLSMPHADYQVVSASIRATPENTNYKDTKKFTWLADEKHVPVVAVEFEPLITKANVTKVCYVFLLVVTWLIT